MLRGDHSFALSVIASAAVHVALAVAMMQAERPGAGAVAAFKPQPVAPTASVYLPDPDSSDGFGLPDGVGVAANASPGERPMLGPDADQMQAFLSRDPAGPGRVGDDPSMSLSPAPLLGVASMAADFAPPKIVRRGDDQTSLERAKLVPLAAPNTDGGGAVSASPAPAADPAILSDSESDPFASAMHVEFRDGRVNARLGRKVKTVRPRLTLAAKYDLMTSDRPSMKVRLTIDDQGAVRLVDIVQSSGSDGADQAVKVALYQWWVEPKAAERTLTFTIGWR